MFSEIYFAEVTVSHHLKVKKLLNELVFKLDVCIGNLEFMTLVLLLSSIVISLDFLVIPHLQFFTFVQVVKRIDFNMFALRNGSSAALFT